MLSFIPHSVRRAQAGFVRNPAACWSINVPQWIPAPKKAVAVDMAAVDRTVDVLTRFVAAWVTQSRDARREYAVREAGAKWTREAWTPAWSNVMEYEDMLAKAAKAREHLRLVSMPEAEWHAYCRAAIADAPNLGPLVTEWAPINAERAAIAEQERVWQEMSCARLHNRQRAAPVRVARVVVRGHFATLGDSDSE